MKIFLGKVSGNLQKHVKLLCKRNYGNAAELKHHQGEKNNLGEKQVCQSFMKSVMFSYLRKTNHVSSFV